MTRVPLILAHEALRRLARIAGRRAGIPAEASLSLRLGRWYVHEPQRDPGGYGVAVWPEGDGNGGGWSEHFDRIDGGGWSEHFDRIDRGRVFTVLSAAYYDGGNSVVVTLTRDEVTGDGADVLRRQRDEERAAWEREHGGAVGERYAASVGGGAWTVAEERGDDFVLRGERGEVWEVSRDFLAAEVRAGRKALRAEVDEADARAGRFAELLRATADALKGLPQPLALHSWHDLPEVAAALRTEVERERAMRDAEREEYRVERDRLLAAHDEMTRRLVDAAALVRV